MPPPRYSRPLGIVGARRVGSAPTANRAPVSEKTHPGPYVIDGRAIRGPRRKRGHRDLGERQQNGVVVHPPPGEVAPGLIAIGDERDPVRRQLVPYVIELGPCNGNGVVRSGIGIEGNPEESAILRKAMYPARMQMPSGPALLEDTHDAMSAAESRTVPAAVIHDRSGCGERKKFSAAYDVCVSSSSVNHRSHSNQ